MADQFSERSLAGARFRNVDLARATFEDVSLAGARFDDADFSGVKIRGAILREVDIVGELEGMRVNGIDVGPLIEAERREIGPTVATMSATMRVLTMAVGLLFIVFAIVVAVYAGEPFNIATLFGVVGIAMMVKLYQKRPTEA